MRAMAIKFFLILTTILFLVSLAAATAGTATYYNPPYVPSSCYGYKNHGVMVAAASEAIWDHRGACGKKLRVVCTGPTNRAPHPCTGKEVTVEIVDYCPKCGGTIDLSHEAFAVIASPSAGRVKIDYH